MTRLLSSIGALAMVFAVTFTLPTVAATTGTEAALRLRIHTTGEPERILTLDLQRWSTDEERVPIVSALTAPPAAEGAGRGPGGRGGAGIPGRGSGRGPAPAAPETQGGAARQGAANASSDSTPAPSTTGTGRGAGGRGAAAGARGGRGRGGTANVSPLARLAAAIKAAPTLGYLWGGVTGYSVKYAWRSSTSGRAARLVLITDRRLDIPTAVAAPAAPATAAAGAGAAGSPGDAAADFTVIEIRFDPKGTGEGKTSLTASAVVDQTAGTIAVQNYDALPLQLRITP
jgi:hypothetical protein